MFKSSVITRIVIGMMMILFLAGMLVLEGWLSGRNYFIKNHQATGLGVAAVLCLLLLGGMLELYRLGKNAGLVFSIPLVSVGIVVLTLEPLLANWMSCTYVEIFPFLLFLGFSLAALRHGLSLGFTEVMKHLSWTCFALIYLGVGSWFMVKIRLLGMTSGHIAVQIGPLVFFLATVKSTDIGAYLLGRAFGRHKWVPKISPGKTWEGLAGGIAVSIITASLLAKAFGIMSIGHAIWFGLTMAIIGQLGDLLESMLKRDAGSKDSARLLPEFGGVLDLLDSLLIAAPFAYMWLLFFGHRY